MFVEVSSDNMYSWKDVLTPFMSGISEAGSVDMEASSTKTIGKSDTFRAIEAEVTQVVQT